MQQTDAAPSAILGCGTYKLNVKRVNPEHTFACSCLSNFMHGITNENTKYRNDVQKMNHFFMNNARTFKRSLSNSLEVAVTVSKT